MTIPDNEMNGIKDTITIKILFFPTQFLKRCANTLVLHQLSNGQCSTGWRYSTQLTTGLPAGTCQAWISTSIKPISLQAIQTVTSNEKLKEHFLGRININTGKKGLLHMRKSCYKMQCGTHLWAIVCFSKGSINFPAIPSHIGEISNIMDVEFWVYPY